MYELTTQADMPVSVAALRDHCRVSGEGFDTQLTRSWYAAAHDIEKRAGILLRPCSVRVTLRGGSAVHGCVLPVGPVDYSSVSMSTEAGNPVSEGWYVSPNTAEPTICVDDASLFEHDETYLITFSAGLASIPADLMVAALELTAHHFENREATISGTIISDVPSSVWSIVANHSRGKV